MTDGWQWTEIGEVPRDWQVKRLGELGAFLKGSGVRKDESQSGSLPCVRYGEIYTHHHNVIRKFNSHISKDIALTAVRLKKGDILFAGSGETKEEIGKAVAFVDNCEAYAGGDIVIFRPLAMDSVFLGYYCNSPVVGQEKTALGQGNAVVHISATALASIKVCVPSLAEQTAIANVLSDTDKLLDSLQRLIDKKQGVKQATMQQLLSGQTRLPGFDGEWQVRRLGDFGSCLRGVGYNPQEDLFSADTNESVRLFRANNIQQSKIVLDGLQFVSSRRVLEQQLLKKDDILICMANGSKELVGKSARFFIEDGMQYTFGAFMGCYRPDNASIVAKFVFYLFNSHEYRAQISMLLAGSAINNLAPSAIEDLMVNIPVQWQEQTAIAQVLADMDAEITALHKRLGKTRQLKQALMQELLSGKTRLRGQP